MKMSGRNHRKQDRQRGAKPRTLAGKIGGVLLAAAIVLTLLPVSMASAAETDYQTEYPSGPGNKATIPVSQTVKNGSGSDTFTYSLTPNTSESDENAPMPEGKGTENGKYEFQMTDNDSTNIVIACTEPGIWYYSLELNKDSAGSDEDVTYSTTKYRIGVKCVNKDGELQTVINAWADGDPEDRKADEADFTITYPETPQPQPSAPCIGDPSVTKIITDAKGNTVNPTNTTDFHFTLTPVKSTYPLPNGSGSNTRLTITGANSDEFGDIVFTEEGTYSYIVTEEKGKSDDGYTYDQKRYRIDYDLTTGDDGNLKMTRSVYRIDVSPEVLVSDDSENVTFTNIYNGTSTTAKKDNTTPKVTPTSKTKSGSVKTGDNSPIALYAGLLAAAVVVLIVVLVMRKRRRGNQ